MLIKKIIQELHIPAFKFTYLDIFFHLNSNEKN